MARSYNERQRPTINTLASNPVQYEVHLIGIENSQPVVIVGHIHCDLALAIASAWFSLSEWVKGDPVWRKLWILRSGAALDIARQSGVRLAPYGSQDPDDDADEIPF